MALRLEVFETETEEPGDVIVTDAATLEEG